MNYGQQLTKQSCVHCGAPILIEHNKCLYCGSSYNMDFFKNKLHNCIQQLAYSDVTLPVLSIDILSDQSIQTIYYKSQLYKILHLNQSQNECTIYLDDKNKIISQLFESQKTKFKNNFIFICGQKQIKITNGIIKSFSVDHTTKFVEIVHANFYFDTMEYLC